MRSPPIPRGSGGEHADREIVILNGVKDRPQSRWTFLIRADPSLSLRMTPRELPRPSELLFPYGFSISTSFSLPFGMGSSWSAPSRWSMVLIFWPVSASMSSGA